MKKRILVMILVIITLLVGCSEDNVSTEVDNINRRITDKTTKKEVLQMLVSEFAPEYKLISMKEMKPFITEKIEKEVRDSINENEKKKESITEEAYYYYKNLDMLKKIQEKYGKKLYTILESKYIDEKGKIYAISNYVDIHEYYNDDVGYYFSDHYQIDLISSNNYAELCKNVDKICRYNDSFNDGKKITIRTRKTEKAIDVKKIRMAYEKLDLSKVKWD